VEFSKRMVKFLPELEGLGRNCVDNYEFAINVKVNFLNRPGSWSPSSLASVLL
jgi:hypothetical protein